MNNNLYIDAEWFPNQELFLIGFARENGEVGQLYNRSLTLRNFMKLLRATDGYIYFYGPDIGMCEKYFGIDIRSQYKCINLLRITRAEMPRLKSWRLDNIERYFGLKRHVSKYKKSIFQIYSDWNDKKYRERVLMYNRDDVANLVTVKQKLFAKFKITHTYQKRIRLA